LVATISKCVSFIDLLEGSVGPIAKGSKSIVLNWSWMRLPGPMYYVSFFSWSVMN